MNIPDILGAVTMFGVGTVIGVIGVVVLLYWILDEAADANNSTDVIEGIGERSGSAIVVMIGVLLTIGDQLVQIVADLIGIIDAPVVVGHVIGGLLAWLGLQGQITEREFLIFFGIVTVVALIWRASLTRGRGI